MAEELGDPVVLSRALGALGNVLDGRSLLRDHLQVTFRRLEASMDSGADDLIERIDAVSGAGMALMYVGGFALIGAGEVVYRRVNQISASGVFGRTSGSSSRPMLPHTKELEMIKALFRRPLLTAIFVVSAFLHALVSDAPRPRSSATRAASSAPRLLCTRPCA